MGKKLFLTRSLLVFVLYGPALVLASAAATVSTEYAEVTLQSERPYVKPGQTLWLGLRFELIPHWHVYWRNPGASGTAPVIRWTLPDGWNAGEIHWPVPKRIQVGPLTNYGYEGSVTFLVPVQIPAGALPAGQLTIIADAEWLVCREECIPETGQFTLQLGKSFDRASADTETFDRFERTRAQWPEAKTMVGRYSLEGDTIEVTFDSPGLIAADPTDIWFAANQWGPVDASGKQGWARTAAELALSVPAGDLPPGGNATLNGLLVVESKETDSTVRRGYHARLVAGTPLLRNETLGFWTALVFALAGGLILNVMPCVLPVLGIKILSFTREADGDRGRLAAHGMLYSAGVLISFALLATVLLIVRSGGESLGWGFQLQSPALVTLLAYLMLLVGLNLAGVFSVGGGLMGAGQALTATSGRWNTFATGVLATVVASPCTAPFMGAALGFTITRPAWEALAVFLALGAGFALPVLLLSLFPAWLGIVPKPGGWMKHFQQALAFPMFATAAWLMWVLSQQADTVAYGAALAGLVVVAMAAWLYGQWNPRGWRLGLLSAGLTATLALIVGPMAASNSLAYSAIDGGDKTWSKHQVQTLLAAGRPVFVNFTAAWCITCKVNEQVALSTENTRRLFESRSVTYLVADWTRRDPTIGRELESHGRSGVPLYLLYSPRDEQPLVLPQLLSEGIIAKAINAL